MAIEKPSAVRFFAPDNPALNINLKTRLVKRRMDLLEELMVALDYGDYCLRRGRIEGVDNSIQFCIDLENELQERNK